MPKLSAEKNILDKFGGKLSVGVNAFFGYQSYKDARSEGSSRLGAAAKAGTDMFLFDMIGMGPMLGMQAAEAIPSMAVGGYEALGKLTRRMNQQSKQVPFVNSTFVDTPQAYTMRQAGMQIAQNSQYNLQQTLMGNEAQYLK